MPHLDIVWQRVMKGAETCERCGDTGASAARAVETLRRELAAAGVRVSYREEALPLFAVAESNALFFNGEPIESLLGAQVGMNHCSSCCELLGQPTQCRTLTVRGQTYEGLPEELILKAGRLAAQKLLAGDKDRQPKA